jgi:hypothetical protein
VTPEREAELRRLYREAGMNKREVIQTLLIERILEKLDELTPPPRQRNPTRPGRPGSPPRP